MTRYRVAVLSYHPMPYHAAFYRALHADPRIHETILYLDDFGVRSQFDPEFKHMVAWDSGVLTGHSYKFLANWTTNKHRMPFGRINPGIVPELLFGRYDAILTDYANVSTWLACVTAKARGFAIIMRAEADLDRPYRDKWTDLKERYLSSVLRRVDAVMYSCEKNRRYFQHFGVPRDKLFPLTSSVDNHYFIDLSRHRERLRDELRRRHGVPAEAVVAMFAGRMTKRKRAVDLARAFAEVSPCVPRLWVMFVGDGPERETIDSRLAGNGRVVFTGFRNHDELPSYYFASDMFVMPSEWDPSPKALNEALICGLPVLISAGVGLAHDIVVDGVNGFVFDAGDVSTLARGLLRLSSDAELRASFSRHAETAARACSPQANVDGFVAALDHVFAERRSRNHPDRTRTR